MTEPTPELSHPVRLDRITIAGLDARLAPVATVRAALARRFDLVALDAFVAELSVQRRSGTGWIEVTGTVTAEVVQSCVVTTEPVRASVTAEIMELFDDSGSVDPAEIDLDPMADTPEPIVGDSLDIGEIAAQAFGLALDPYPRAPGIDLAVIRTGETQESDGSPFAKLAALHGRSVKKE